MKAAAISMPALAPSMITGLTLTDTGAKDAFGQSLYLPELSYRFDAGGGRMLDAKGPIGEPGEFKTPVQIAVEISELLHGGMGLAMGVYDLKFTKPMVMSPRMIANCSHAEQMKEKRRREEALQIQYLSQRKEMADLMRAAQRVHKRHPELINDRVLVGKLVMKEFMEMEAKPARSYSPRPRMGA